MTTRVAEDSRADELVSGYVVQHPHFSEVLWRGQRFCFTAPDVAHDEGPVGDGALVAPMPGTVLDVRVVVGDDVEHNQVLAILEAMKMEIAVRAPFAGVVTEVAAAAGDQVAMGAALVRVEAGPQ